jgi:hypothetical protein
VLDEQVKFLLLGLAIQQHDRTISRPVPGDNQLIIAGFTEENAPAGGAS